MDRRRALTTLGATAVGLTAGGVLAPHSGAAEEHGHTPLGGLHAYLCAYHIRKDRPNVFIEAHHYCGAVNGTLHQCIVYDKSSGEGAKILGVEYIIPDEVYRKLKPEEQKYYHPHTYEVTSGLLIAPGMDKEAEEKFMAGLLTTWGKCWHVWPDPTTDLPMGEPVLMWAVTKDGQMPDKMLADYDKKFGISTAEIRKRRAKLGPVPQIDPPRSVDAIGRQWTNDGPDEPKKP
jgi:hypothetical protein